MIQKRILITGKVQGVSYRASTVREAARIGGLKGHVRNLPDGCVEVIVQGQPERVKELEAWCRKGPPRAQVLSVQATEESPDPGLPDFDIRY